MERSEDPVALLLGSGVGATQKNSSELAPTRGSVPSPPHGLFRLRGRQIRRHLRIFSTFHPAVTAPGTMPRSVSNPDSPPSFPEKAVFQQGSFCGKTSPHVPPKDPILCYHGGRFSLGGDFIVWYALALIALLVLAVLLYVRHVRFGILRQVREVEDRLTPLREALKRGAPPDVALLRALGKDLRTRNPAYLALEEAGKGELFPPEFRTREAFGASDLALWLEHPHALGVPPDELELVETVTVQHDLQGPLEYFVYRFRVAPPARRSSHGWMLRVSGPYPPEATWPLFSPPGTGSPLQREGRLSGKSLVDRVHRRCLRDGRLDLWIQEALRRR